MIRQFTCKRKVLFLSTNTCWGASEYLWYESTKELHSRGYDIFVCVYNYQHPKYNDLSFLIGPEKVYNQRRFSPLRFYKRWLNRLFKVFRQIDGVKNFLVTVKPDLVIVSHGNAVCDQEIPLMLMELRFRYVIVNHLVSNSNWPILNESGITKLMNGLQGSVKNYFVSENNMRLLEQMIGMPLNNYEIIFNPIRDSQEQESKYPNFHAGFAIAFVGRLECFHKGIDLLIEVIKKRKWQERNITFNIYGDGPHRSIIERWIELYHLSNVHLRGFVLDKKNIWDINHILILPSRMEGQSVSLSEALHFKRTVIGTNVGGIEHFISDNLNGFIARYANEDELDDAMERAWQKRFEWELMGKVANKRWKSIVPKDPVEDFCNRILNHLI